MLLSSLPPSPRLTNRSPEPKSLQERVLSRVAVAGGFATALFGMTGFLPGGQLAPFAMGALPTLGALCVVAAFVSRLSSNTRSLVVTALLVLAPFLTLSSGSSNTIPWFLTFLAVIASTLLIGPRSAFGVSLVLSLGLPFASRISQGQSHADVWINAGLCLVLANICVLWIDYGLTRLKVTLTQRDDLLSFVQEETEERIAQLEKQQALERQLRQSQKMEALGTLAGGIAHDFNNLLLVIASGTQSATHSDPEELAEILQELKEAADRGTGLTQQLLAFGRRRIAERGALRLNDEISKSLQLIKRLIPSNITLEFTADPDVASVEATPVDVDQVIMNLCINARDAMPHGGRVEISTQLHQEPGHLGQEAIISVRDFGVGMTEEQKSKAFEPFYTTKLNGRGTGLGLSVVQTIVQGHKGRIELESELRRGTVFRVYLPHIDQSSNILTINKLGQHSVGGECILLVDDDPAVRKGIARVLRRAGYDVIVASDGVEALREYTRSSRPVDLIVTDAVMPNMGGRDLVEAVTEINSQQACLICSGYDAGSLDQGFFLEPGREFLAKPFDNDQLLLKVEQLLATTKLSVRPPPSSGTTSFRGTLNPTT